MNKVLLTLGVIGFTGIMGLSTQAAGDGAALYKRTCAGCHGQEGEKEISGTLPIKGMTAAQLVTLLDGYKAGTQGGKTKSVMGNIAKRLNDDDRTTITNYIETTLK